MHVCRGGFLGDQRILAPFQLSSKPWTHPVSTARGGSFTSSRSRRDESGTPLRAHARDLGRSAHRNGHREGATRDRRSSASPSPAASAGWSSRGFPTSRRGRRNSGPGRSGRRQVPERASASRTTASTSASMPVWGRKAPPSTSTSERPSRGITTVRCRRSAGCYRPPRCASGPRWRGAVHPPQRPQTPYRRVRRSRAG